MTNLRETPALCLLTGARPYLTPQPGDAAAATGQAVFGAVLASVVVVVATVGPDWVRAVLR